MTTNLTLKPTALARMTMLYITPALSPSGQAVPARTCLMTF
jgi:hypothetical protein